MKTLILTLVAILFQTWTALAAPHPNPLKDFLGCYDTIGWNGKTTTEGSIFFSRVMEEPAMLFYENKKPYPVEIPAVDFVIFNPFQRMDQYSSAFLDRGTFTRSSNGWSYLFDGVVFTGFYYEDVVLHEELSINDLSQDGTTQFHARVRMTRKNGQVADDSDNTYMIKKRVGCTP